MLISRFILILSISLSSGLLFAETFEDFDTDKDGVISGTEGSSHYTLSVQWTELDTDLDGMLSPEEFSSYIPPIGAEAETENENPLDPLDSIDAIDPIDPIDPTNPIDQGY